MARASQPRTLALVGGSSLALALGVTFLPWLFPAGIFRPLSAVLASPVTILLFGGAAGLLGVQALRESATGRGDDGRPGDTADRPKPWQPDRPPERAYYDEYRTAGSEVDAALDPDPAVSASNLASRRQTARNRIRETAISTIAADEAIGREAAAKQVEAGTWTDDPRAAAFLGGRALAPLRIRIRDWASGEQFERWARHAMAEVEARERGENEATGRDGQRKSVRDGQREVTRR